MSSNASNGSAKKVKIVSVNETHILDMNDDCLRSVFSHLNSIDLCAVKETCTRFESLADDEFRCNFGNDEFVFCSSKHLRDYPRRYLFDNSPYTAIGAKQLHLFGKFMRKLEVFQVDDWNVILENCSGLRELMVRECDLAQFRPTDKPSAGNLNGLDYLEFESCRGSDADFTRIMSYYANLNMKKMTVAYYYEKSDSGGEFLQQKFPQLKNIALEGFFDRRSIANINEFFRLNPQIERFNSRNNINYEHYLNAIVEHCVGIESIEIDCDLDNGYAIYHQEHIKDLSRLNKLKELYFSCGDKRVEPALETLAEKNLLDTLGLSHGKLTTNLCHTICKMTNLKTLRFVYFSEMNGIELKTLTSELNLKNIELIATWTLDIEDIAAVIIHSRTLEKVTFDPIHYQILDERLLGLLIKARMASAAGFPLEMSIHNSGLGSISAALLHTASNYIKLKMFDAHTK